MKILKKFYIVLLFVLSITILSSCGLFGSKTTEEKATVNFDQKYNSLYPKILKVFNEDFEENMKESDFLDNEMYQEYLNICKFSATYTEAMINFNISESNAVAILIDFSELAMYQELDFLSFMNYFTKLEGYGLNPNKLASLLVDLSKTSIDISLNTIDENGAVLLNQIKELYEIERDALVTSLEAVITYLSNVNNAIDVELINNLLEPKYISESELFVLKDEIVGVLKETLPSVKDFERMLLISKVLFNYFIGENINLQLDDTYINKVATINHHTFKLFIEFIDAINYEVYSYIRDITSDIAQGNCYVDEYWEDDELICAPYEVDMEKIVELILYFDNFYKEFKNKNSASFDALKTLYEDAELRQINEDIARGFIEYALIYYLDFPKSEISKLRELVNDMIETTKLIEQAQEIIYGLGLDIYDEFINTNGAILFKYEEFYQAVVNEAPVSEVNNALENLISDLVDYNDIALGDLTLEEIEIIVNALMHQNKYNMFSNVDMDDLDELNEFIDYYSIEASKIIYHIVEIEKEFIKILDQNGFNLTEFENIDELNIGDSFNHHLIIALSEALDEEMKATIYQDFESYLDLMLEYSDLLEIIDGIETKNEILGYLEYILKSITVIASYDFNNLTPEGLEYYLGFRDFIFVNDDDYEYY